MAYVLSCVIIVYTLFTPQMFQAAPIPIRVVLAVPPEQTMTEADAARAQQVAHDALAYWTRHDPAHPAFTVDYAGVETVPQPGQENWLNRDPAYAFPSFDSTGARGMALEHDALVLLEQRYMPWRTEAVTAHEVGHARYGLPDLYHADPSCRTPDLMCNAEASYPADWLGCQSLAALGGACTQQYLPILERP